MAPRARRRRPLSALLLAICVLLVPLQVTLQVAPPCTRERHYEHLGRCCSKCEPDTCLLSALLPLTVCVCPVAQTSTWTAGMKKINVCCIKSVMQARPWWRWTLATARPHGAAHARPATTGTQTASAAAATWSVRQASKPSILCSSTWTRCAHPASSASSQMSFHPRTNADPGPKVQVYLPSLIILLLFVSVVLVAAVALGVYYRKGGKALTANLWNWVNDACSSLSGNKESSGDCCVGAHSATSSQREVCEGGLLMSLEEKMLPENMCCLEDGPGVCGPVCAAGGSCAEGGDARMFTLVSEVETQGDLSRKIPTEDEYTDRPSQLPDGSLFLIQPGSRSTPAFQEPLEVGENDSLSQCFTGTESTADSEGCSFIEPPCRTDCTPSSSEKYLKKEIEGDSCLPWVASSSSTDGYTGCGNTPGEDHEPLMGSLKCGPLPQCAYSMGLPGEAAASVAEAGEQLQDRADVKLPSSERGASGSGNSPSDQPPASGNVTGNSNSTFISSGQVMNFKGDIIVVYVSQTSQEGPGPAEPEPEPVGRPVQEETLASRDSFAGTAPRFPDTHATGAGLQEQGASRTKDGTSRPVQEQGGVQASPRTRGSGQCAE
ncbi:tumor necrosis factor receptor superfamily member 11A isoform X3 [Peromyscus californicus insignis]|uniref:tumor necrosis factor receptor superfamily member 11A isoform X3 n=1 Tax=Peromyscus californicus insignis TaxID=564181 RepID=UPI0022A6F187|nr:tumor necrosis factor receptor superfamily member 11A isoform X3 [Peromyscus californicus insignis]